MWSVAELEERMEMTLVSQEMWRWAKSLPYSQIYLAFQLKEKVELGICLEIELELREEEGYV